MKNNILSRNVIQYVNTILEIGIENNSSDIHIMYDDVEMEIKFRVDGILREIEELYLKIDKNILEKNIIEIISRIKILSNMNVAEKRKPQDGSFSFLFIKENLKEEYDIRTAFLPRGVGESVVLRILKNYLKNIKLETLGFTDNNIDKIKKMLNKKCGLILVTGPTGSGKSTTLNSMIEILNNGEKKIISIEDPIENKIKGIIQVQINSEIGVTFSEILKSSLRNDPDIIIISEIRDEITAEIAIRAALTGHLVIATLHTKDTVSSIIRLEDMGIPKYLVLDSIVGIISQRLVKREGKKIGRISINEVLYIDESVKKIIRESENSSKIKEKLLFLKEGQFTEFLEDINIKIEKKLISEKVKIEFF